ncbi:MAG: protein YgfX [Pseudomonadota bacterium]
MSSNRFVVPISVRPEASKILAVLLLGFHICSLMVLPWLDLSVAVVISVALLIGFSLVYYIRIHVFQKGKKAVAVFEWTASGRLKIWDGQGQEFPVQLGDGMFIHPRLIILNLISDEGFRRSLILLPDSADSDTLRRLRSRLLLRSWGK